MLVLMDYVFSATCEDILKSDQNTTSVMAQDMVLLPKPKFSEHSSFQREALVEAVGLDGATETELFFTDNSF